MSDTAPRTTPHIAVDADSDAAVVLVDGKVAEAFDPTLEGRRAAQRLADELFVSLKPGWLRCDIEVAQARIRQWVGSRR